MKRVHAIRSSTRLLSGLLPGLLLAVMTADAGAQASGGARPTAGPVTPPAAQPPRPRAPMRTLTLTSPDFVDGGTIPAMFAQTGRDVSPALQWSGAPDSTRSYVLIVHDADAPMGDGLDDQLHWMVWNIPGTATSLPRGVTSGSTLSTGARQISVSGPYYRGPAAPSTGPAHHYVFDLYALDITVNVAATGMSPAATREAVLRIMAQHVLGKGTLVGTYRRAAP